MSKDLPLIYFDHASSTKIFPDVLKSYNDSLQRDFANPSSSHKMGRELTTRVEKSRQGLLKSLGLEGELLFCGSATEANNLVIQSAPLKEQKIVWFSRGDHPSLVAPIKDLEKKKDILLKALPILEDGSLNWDSFLKELDSNTGLILGKVVHNQTGIFHSWDEYLPQIRKMSPKAWVHLDASQAVGKVDLSWKKGTPDSLTFSSHKVGGPKGIAGLFHSRKNLTPLFYGGGQEKGLRSSTVAASLIFALEKAVRLHIDIMNKRKDDFLSWNIMLRQGIKEFYPKAEFPFPLEKTSPFILGILLPGVSSDILLRFFEERNVYLSSSSACSSRVKTLNPSLMDCQIPQKDHKYFLRLSLGFDTERKQIEAFLNHFKEIMDHLSFYV
jgi:cysteine desulfurase